MLAAGLSSSTGEDSGTVAGNPTGGVSSAMLRWGMWTGGVRRSVSVNPTSEAVSDPVEIRIRNDSNVDFDRVRVQFPDQHEVDYGPVPKGGVTDFKSTIRAYRYAGVSVQVGNRE